MKMTCGLRYNIIWPSNGLAYSGNTFRTRNTKFYRKLVRHGIIIKESDVSTRPKYNPCRERRAHILDSTETEQTFKRNHDSAKSYKESLPDPDLECCTSCESEFCTSCEILEYANILDGVPYSINKKGRWELETLIKKAIEKQETCSIVLTETCTLFKSNRTNCFIATNPNEKEDIAFECPLRTHLVNEESIWTEYLKQKSRVDTKIQILKPYEDGSRIGSICSNHKISGFDAVKKTKPRKFRESRVHKKNVSRTLREEFDEDLKFNNQQIVHSKTLNTTEQTNREKLGFNFVDKLYNNNETRTKRRRKKRKKCKNKGIKLENTITEYDRDNRMDPVTVLIPCQDVLPASLVQNYGDDYVECPCYPRRFIINVTERLEYHMLTSGCWKGKDINNLNINSCITFSEDLHYQGISKVEGFVKFRINFNIQTQNNVVRILTLSDKFRGCMSDIIQKTLYYINMISASEMTTTPVVRNGQLQVDQPFKILNMFLKVDVKYDTFSTKSLFQDLFTSERYKTTPVSNIISSPPKGVFEPKTCGICHKDESDYGTNLLVLTSCHHGFCERCWSQYINCRLHTAFVNITCPEYKCSSIVPDTLLLTFISVTRVVGLRKRRQELSLFSSGQMKWCPNRKCSHALRVTNTPEATSISCMCGITLCFNCLAIAHWPLSCDYTSVYREKLKGSKVETSKKLHIIDKKGAHKHCPNCCIPIEKVGKGIFMNCICGNKFCWGCLQSYPNHERSMKCFACDKKKVGGKKPLTKNEVAKRNKKENSTYFKMALSHRVVSKNQNSLNILRSAVTKIIFECKNMPLKRCPSYLTMIVRFDDSDKKRSNNLAVKDRISGALWELLNVYKDFHYIAEYALIFMDELRDNQSEKSTIHLPSHINQLNLYAENIASLVKSSDDLSDYRLLIETLLALEKQCQKQMQQFISVIRKLK